MQRTQIYLTEAQREALAAIAGETGTTQSELIRRAVDGLIEDFRGGNRLDLLRRGRGLWRSRKDLPDFPALRRELDRTERKR